MKITAKTYNNYSYIIESIKKTMKENKITATQMGESIGLSRTSISGILTYGKLPTLINILKILDFLNLKFEYYDK